MEDLRSGTRALAGVEEREQDHGAELGDRGCRDHLLTPVAVGLVRVLQRHDDDAERRGDEDDRDQEGRLDQPDGVQHEGRAESEHEGDREACKRGPKQRATEPIDLDLPAGKEQKAREAHGREDLDGRRRGGDAEPVRTDDDPADQLQHDRRYEDLRHEGARERRQEGDHRDHHEARVRVHGPSWLRSAASP